VVELLVIKTEGFGTTYVLLSSIFTATELTVIFSAVVAVSEMTGAMLL
jgi:hypothetical protein